MNEAVNQVVGDVMDSAVEAATSTGLSKGAWFGIGVFTGGVLLKVGQIVKNKFFTPVYVNPNDGGVTVNPNDDLFEE